MPVIVIAAGQVEMKAELNESKTARDLWESLPFQGRVNTWGDEIYFSIPLKAELEKDAVEVVREGDLGYWPTGSAFCIFFGPTPASTATEIKPASAVNLIGKLLGDPKDWKKVAAGQAITIRQAIG